MKYHFQVILASLVVLLTALAPSVAYARTPGGPHTRSQTYHNRTPRVHAHTVHPHHGK